MQSLFYTINGGRSWKAVGGNLEEHPSNGPAVLWVEILPGNDSNIYFSGTSTGLYSTTSLNGPSTFWTQEDASTIGNVVIDMIDARASDGFIAVATHGQGVYSANVIRSPNVKLICMTKTCLL